MTEEAAKDRTIALDEFGRLVLSLPDGRVAVGVEPVRAFPLSHPDQFISFCDTEGREVYCLASMGTLVAEDQQLLREELSFREFVPHIKRIVRVVGEGHPAELEVVTDRGPTRFTVENDDDVRRLGPHKVMITDSRKLRYLVDDLRALDHHSRRLLERFL
jgi:Domain of unknown function (DUF1854)